MSDEFLLEVPDARPPLTFDHDSVSSLGAGQLHHKSRELEVEVAVVPSPEFSGLCQLIVGPAGGSAAFCIRQSFGADKVRELAAGFDACVAKNRGASFRIPLGRDVAVLRLAPPVLAKIAARLRCCCTSLRYGSQPCAAGELDVPPAPALELPLPARRVVVAVAGVTS